MMSIDKRPVKEEDLLRAAYDLLGDICLTHNVQVGYKVLPTEQRGVFEIELVAMRIMPNQKKHKLSKYSMRFPNSQNISLAGAFFRAANQLDNLLDLSGKKGAMVEGEAAP